MITLHNLSAFLPKLRVKKDTLSCGLKTLQPNLLVESTPPPPHNVPVLKIQLSILWHAPEADIKNIHLELYMHIG